MSNTISLNGQSLKIELEEGYTLHAPGLKGTLTKLDEQQGETRSVGGLVEQRLLNKIEEAEMISLLSFELKIEEDLSPSTGTTRSDGLTAVTKEGEAAMVLEVPKIRKQLDSVVLYTDDAGVSRWIFPNQHAEEDKQISFHLPREGAPKPPQEEGQVSRGPISLMMRRTVRVLAWLLDPVIGTLAHSVARKWENKNRPYGFKYIQPEQIGDNIPWNDISGQRSLLLLHGTFSTAEDAFYGLIHGETFKTIFQQYGARVFAFNHPSLHHSPAENIETFFKMLPAEVKQLDLDIITHSRGGLVGRELIERTKNFNINDVQLNIGKAVYVAGPHQGTILTDGKNWVEFIDRYTNLIAAAPDNVFTLIIEGLLTLVKVIARGATDGLPGLKAMLPEGDYMGRLNTAKEHGTTYYAMGANYLPNDENLLARFAKKMAMKAVDKIFEEDSDGVVPTKGCFEAEQSFGFPIPDERRELFQLEMNIHHLNFFDNDAVVNKQILKWLAESPT